jgi:hypothetical protein
MIASQLEWVAAGASRSDIAHDDVLVVIKKES